VPVSDARASTGSSCARMCPRSSGSIRTGRTSGKARSVWPPSAGSTVLQRHLFRG